MTLWKWSRTAASNATADSSINWAEGMAPSAVNDSARAEMAAVAKYRDDVAGIIATGGTSTAYTVASFQVFDSLAHLDGAKIAFVPHATNGATVTLNVDSLGGKPLRSAPGVELMAGILIQGTPYTATYNNTDAVWYLNSFYANPYQIPIGGGMLYTGSSAPNSAFVFPFGQAVSRSTYSAYFSLVSTRFGIGDGSTTFNVPDLRGRIPVGLDNMGGTAASRVTSSGSSVDGSTIGATGGAQNVSIGQANLPSVNLNLSITDTHKHSFTLRSWATAQDGSPITVLVPDSFGGNSSQTKETSTTSSGSITGTAALGGSGVATAIMPPSIVLPYIMRII